MEGKLSQGGIVPVGGSFSGFDLSGSMHQPQHHLHQGSSVHSACRDGFPLSMGALQNCDQTFSMVKQSVSEDDEPSLTEDGGVDGRGEAGRGKKGTAWQRVKWTDEMVKLLITALSYIGEDSSSDAGNGGRRKFAVLQKKGKWKSISKVMAERGYRVSPQQCEDKFNDLNKRYKRLNEMIGRGTCCQVVENPALLDVLDYLSEKDKDDIRKILGSKHLFYEEMCSYHNGNRLHLPHDPALQRSLQAALRNKVDHDNDVKRSHQDDREEDDQDVDSDDHDDYEETYASHPDNRGVYGALGGSAKKLKHGQVQEDIKVPVNSLNCCNKNSNSHGVKFQHDMNQGLPVDNRAAWLQKQWIESRELAVEEKKLQIEVEMLELERQKLKWQRFSKKKDRELEKLRMENEKMKLENERLALEIKRREMAAGFN